jgi:hypothetical protein
MIDVKEILRRGRKLREVAKKYAAHPEHDWLEDELHDAALSYASAIRKVARRGRAS